MKFDAQGRLVSPAGQPTMLGAGEDEVDIDDDVLDEDEDEVSPAVE
jgi:hypothetical protein